MFKVFKRSAVAATLLASVALAGLAIGHAAPAQADNCWESGNIEYCNYANEQVPKYTPRWFSAPGGNNLRRWYVNEIADAYGGTVPKCVGYKAQGSGIAQWLACGYGTFAGEIPSASRPGWIYLEQLANGPRLIFGQGRRNLPCC